MKRRSFLTTLSAGGTGILLANPAFAKNERKSLAGDSSQLSADMVIIGGGMGACAAALAACRNGLHVIMTEETDWIGGQATQQGVPPDEHRWIETHGATASYREFRNRIRRYYKRNYPVTEEAKNRENLNPGDGWVSWICHEPVVGLAVLYEMLAPYLSSGKLMILLEYKIAKADTDRDRIRSVEVRHSATGNSIVLLARYFIDATECGDLLPLSGTEYVTGTESMQQTGELHAPEKPNPLNNQSFTLCFAMEYQAGADNVIDRPAKYDFWKSYKPVMTPPWSGRLLDLKYSVHGSDQPKDIGFDPTGKSTGKLPNLWTYRRILNKNNFVPGFYGSDITIVNWPQNDFFGGNLIDVSPAEFNRHVESARGLNLSLLYWLQTEAPRPDGGTGWPGLRLRGDVLGTPDGMAKYPYIRESRRIKAVFTVLEEHVGQENRILAAGAAEGKRAASFFDSVGIGYYTLDLHPSCAGSNGFYMPSLPFQVPLGALLPQRMNNLLPACKNIGTTHITNGCYREHPVEWSIGEAAGMLVTFAMKCGAPPRAVREKEDLLKDFQKLICSQGLEINWPV